MLLPIADVTPFDGTYSLITEDIGSWQKRFLVIIIFTFWDINHILKGLDVG